jgi:hypothetical protein
MPFLFCLSFAQHWHQIFGIASNQIPNVQYLSPIICYLWQLFSNSIWIWASKCIESPRSRKKPLKYEEQLVSLDVTESELTVWLIGNEDTSVPSVAVPRSKVTQIFIVIARHESTLLESDALQLPRVVLWPRAVSWVDGQSWRQLGFWQKKSRIKTLARRRFLWSRGSKVLV